MPQPRTPGSRARLLALAGALILGQPALAQTLMCTPPPGSAPADAPPGAMLVLVFEGNGAALHGCVNGDECQPITDGLEPRALTEDEIGLGDSVMGIDVRVMRTRRPLAIRVETRDGDSKRLLEWPCSAQ